MRRNSVDIPTPSASPYGQGLALYHQGRYDEAAQVLAQVPHNGDLSGSVARYYLGMSHRALGAQAMSQGHLAEAERHLAAAAQALGRQGDLSSYLACLYARAGKPTDCLRQTDKALAGGADDSRAWLRHAQALWRSARPDEAQIVLRQALRRFGQQAGLHRQLGLFLAGQGRWAEAQDAFARAIQADCSRADAHEYHGLAAAATNNARVALQSLQRAYELRPNDMVLAHRLALTAKVVTQQGHPVAIRLPEPASKPSPSQLGHLAHYVTAEGDFVDAFLTLPPSQADAELFGVLEAALQAAIAQHGDYADLHLRSSAVLARLGRTAEAVSHAETAVKINGRYVRARLHLGRLCADAGRDDEAVEHLEQAIASGADWADVHCAAADLLGSRGRLAEARQHLTRALQLNPSYSRATEAMASLAA